MLFLLILCLLLLCLGYLLVSLRLIQGLHNLTHIPNQEPLPSVTVLIAARNEEFRISACLDGLALQNYPKEKLQIIVINDRSEDQTNSVMNEYKSILNNLVIVDITEKAKGISPKKNALSKGLLQATGEIILTTDADCLMGKSWVSSMVSEFAADTGMVVGLTHYYPPLEGKSRSWGIHALEFISYSVVSSGLIGLKFPVLANANNIAYRKKTYVQAKGFEMNRQIVSGDDDFLLQAVDQLKEWKIRFSILPESQVQTEPPLDWLQFWEQRKRWASKCSLYAPKQVLFLSVIFGFYVFIITLLCLGLFIPKLFLIGALAWLVKTLCDRVILHYGLRIFQQQKLLQYFWPAALLHIPLIIAAVIAGSFGQFTWKGQTTGKRI